MRYVVSSWENVVHWARWWLELHINLHTLNVELEHKKWNSNSSQSSVVVGKTFHNFSSHLMLEFDDDFITTRWVSWDLFVFTFTTKKKEKCIISHVGRLLQLSSGFASLYNSQHSSSLVLGEMKFYFWTVYFSYFITLARLALTHKFFHIKINPNVTFQ